MDEDMKRIYAITLIVLIALAACTTTDDSLEAIAVSRPLKYKELTASFGEQTRTYVEESKYLYWHEDDRLSVFYGDDVNNEYKFEGITGDKGGTFAVVTEGTADATMSLDRIYALYPYDSTATISEQGDICYTLPATQHYASDSFGKGANAMVAVTESTEDRELYFSNLCGYLKVKLYGNILVKSIELKGNGGEKIAGAATISTSADQAPAIVMFEDEGTDESSGEGKSITLDCGEGVAIGATADEATTFWFTLPPTTFSEGITITVTSSRDETFVKSTQKSVTIGRNTIQPMAALEMTGRGSIIATLHATFDPIFKSCSSIKEFAPYVDQMLEVKGVDNAGVSGNTAYACLDGGFVVAWTYDEWPASSADHSTLSAQSLVEAATARISAEHNFIGQGLSRNLKVGILNQTSEDNNDQFLAWKNLFNELQSSFTQAGFDVTIVERDSLTYDFYQNEFFDYDIILWNTHGMYSFLGWSTDHWFLGAEASSPLSGGDGNYDVDGWLDTGTIGRIVWSNGKTYEMVSEEHFRASTKRFNTNAIIFASACLSLCGNDNVSDIFHEKGLATYLGYNDKTCVSGQAAVEFYKGMLQGMTVREAYDRLDDGYKQDKHTYANQPDNDHNAVLQIRGDENLCIAHPELTTKSPIIMDENILFTGRVKAWNDAIVGSMGFLWAKGSDLTEGSELSIDNGECRVVYDDGCEPEGMREFTFTAEVLLSGGEYTFTADEIYYCRSYAKIGDCYIYGDVQAFVTGNNSDNIIYYTSIDNQCARLYYYNIGSARLVSNTYKDGLGMLVYDCAITSTGDYVLGRRISNVKSVVLPRTVTEISNDAFNKYQHLESVTLPASLKTIGAAAFAECRALEKIDIPDGVMSIGGNAFGGCGNLKDIDLPESLVEISYRAFADCDALYDITIPESVVTVGSYAFANCDVLYDITIPESVVTVGSYAFSYCNNLKRAKIGLGVTTLENDVFRDCVRLESVDMGENITYLGDGAFNGCSSLKSIVIPDGVREIRPYTFYKAKSLESITFGDSVENIMKNAFSECEKLQNVVIPNGVTTIGDYAFYRCSGLKSVTLPNSITTMGESLFNACTSLEQINFPSNLTMIPEGFASSCTKLSSVTIPDGIEIIKESAFYYCKSLTDFNIPNSVREIGPTAFSWCPGPSAITIPAGVTNLGGSCLNCSNLKEVHCKPTTPPNGGYAFSTKWVTVYVPSQSVDAYRSNPGWSKYYNIRGE